MKILPNSPLDKASINIQFLRPEILANTVLSLSRLNLEYYKIKKEDRRVSFRISPNMEKQLRLKEMFLAGGLAGALASQYIHGNKSRAWLNRWRYSVLFSLWANYWILVDAAADFKEVDDAASKTLLLNCLKEMLKPIVNIQFKDYASTKIGQYFGDEQRDIFWNALTDYQTPFARISVLYAKRFGEVAESCFGPGEPDKISSNVVKLFIERTVALHKGQFDSFEQSVLDEGHNWKWYRSNVLDAKFSNILFAPLSLFGQNDVEISRRKTLEKGLMLVTELYLHRQLIDDFLDIESDCLEGNLGGPAYLLLASSRLSREEPDNYPMDTSTLDNLDRIIYMRLRSDKEALAKEEERAQEFEKTWGINKEMAARILLNSGTVSILRDIIEDPERMKPYYQQIQDILMVETRAVLPIGYYHLRCVRSFNKLKERLDNIVQD